MAIIVIESGGGGCNPFVFLAILFPPLLLVFGIYYLVKKLWTCGFILLFDPHGVALRARLRLNPMSCYFLSQPG